MKKYCFIILCIVFAAFITSCSEVTPAETFISPSTQTKNDEESDSKTVNDITPEEVHEPSEALVFKNIEDLRKFITLADSSNEEIEEYRLSHTDSLSFTAKELSNISEQIKKSDIPNNEFFNIDNEEFGGTYNSSRNELDLIYIIDGIRYRFIYSYDKPEHSYNGNAIGKCTFEKYEFDLFEGDDCFVGSIHTDYATIRIVIYSNDYSSIEQMVE